MPGRVLAALVLVVLSSARGEDRYPRAECDPKFLAIVTRGPTWLAPEAVPLAVAPPSDDVTRADLRALLDMQARRTPEDLKQIRAELGDLAPIFLARMGGTPARHPRTLAVLAEAVNEVDYFLFAEKFQVMRARPHQLNARIQPAIAVPKHPAYPSGHAGEAATLARIGAAIRPDLTDALVAYGQDVGRRRELAGVHYPSDTVEGVRIGARVAGALLEVPRFQAMIAAAAAEWRPARPGEAR